MAAAAQAPGIQSMDKYAAQGAKQVSPAAERNKQVILDTLRRYIPSREGVTVLEVASGSGQHVAHFAAALPQARFMPTDCVPHYFDSIAAYTAGMTNVAAPQQLDVASGGAWPVQRCDVVVCINMCHIAPYSATQGLIKGAAYVLQPGGILFVYGPFLGRDGKHTTESNAAFDASLRERDPAWGYRAIGDVEALASQHGLQLLDVLDMPANNFALVFQRNNGS